MWEVYQGNPLPITVALLDEDEDPVDVSEYTGIAFDIIPPDGDVITVTPTITEETATAAGILTALETASLPVGTKTRVNLRWTPADGNQRTKYLGKITVREQPDQP